MKLEDKMRSVVETKDKMVNMESTKSDFLLVIPVLSITNISIQMKNTSTIFIF